MKTQFVTLISLTLYLLSLIHVSQSAQIVRIISPTTLAQQFPNGLNERPALFGFPQYGSSITGYVIDKTNVSACEPIPKDDNNPEPAIFLMKRGNCSFVTKVRNAQNSGAKAAIVQDNVQEPTLPYMADDGTARDIEIPSVLIGFDDGNKITASINNHDVVQVVLQWSLPNPDARVEMDIWTSSSVRDPTFAAFKKNFALVASALGNRLYVEPHYYIINGTGRCTRNDHPCGSQCIMNGQYCAADPELDLSKGLTGAQVVIENLRQMCLFQHLNDTNQTLAWWQYIYQFETKCATNEQTWTDACVNEILRSLPVDPQIITNCVKTSGGTDGNGRNAILDSQITKAKEQGVFIIPTIAINNIVYHGSAYCPAPVYQEHCGVFKAVCAGYASTDVPSACVPGCPVDNLDCTTSSSSGVSVGLVIGIVVVALVLAGLGAFIYMRRQQRKMREDLDSILQSYMPIEDGDKLANEQSRSGHMKLKTMDGDDSK